MVVWLAFGFAALVAVVVLGFCLYELKWKATRLRRDLAGLQRLQGDLADVASRLSLAAERAQRLRTGE